MKAKIAHIAYTVRDMNASLDFYSTKLGFDHSFSIQDKDNNPWIEYLKITDGQFIELFYAKDKTTPVPSKDQTYAHLCLEVEDIHATADELTRNGIILTVLPVQGVDLNWQCWVEDPDGNPIEFMQIDPNSPQSKA